MAQINQAPAASLNAVTATGAGTAVPLGPNCVAIGIRTRTTGTPATVSMTLEYSPDGGTTWINSGLAAMTTVTPAFYTAATPIPPAVTHARINLGTLTGGTAPTVTAEIVARTDS